jgi:hypothetical protein
MNPETDEMKPWEYDVPDFDNLPSIGVWVKRVKLTLLKKSLGRYRWFKLCWWRILLTPPKRD